MDFLGIPYTIYLITHWSPTYIDLDPYYVVILGASTVIYLKVHLILTISAAVERILVRNELTAQQALFLPAYYRKVACSTYVVVSLMTALLWAALDLCMEFSLLAFERKPNCAAVGCFLDRSYSYYFSMNGLVLSLTAFALTSLFMIKLRCSQRKSRTLQVHTVGEECRFTQAHPKYAVVYDIFVVSCLYKKTLELVC
ncbi:hypothetical protein COOONC_04732 [Cooperia oncophora]